MQISYNWLKDYCDHDMPAHELAERLSGSGLCVETYEPRDGDWMLDVEVTSNRPDCLSHIGIAREIAAMTGTTITPPSPPATVDEAPASESPRPEIAVDCPDLCPHYTARIIRNVKPGPSPQWMQQRLLTCGLRPVNNIVDITNYILLESGQPMHAFDLGRLAGRRITVRRARKDEHIVTIDGTECRLPEDACVIADETKAVAVAGIMGGLESEINEKTTDVLLESARFDPVSIRRSSRALALSSDSSYRFERGVDPDNVAPASLRGAALIVELAGGETAGPAADIRNDSSGSGEVVMRIGRLRKILGLDVRPDTAAAIFRGLGLSILQCGTDSITVSVPPRRPDLSREIDLIEEIARIHGYEKIPETTSIPIAVAPLSKREVCLRRLKKMLAGHGFTEIMTSSLVSPTPLQLAQPWHGAEPIPLRNPVSMDKTHLRLTGMGNLVQAKLYNSAHRIPDVDIFETGKIYLPSDDGPDHQPEEKNCLSILTDREDGFFVLKGLLRNICSTLYIPGRMVEEREGGPAGAFAGDKSLLLFWGENLLGCVGELDPGLAQDFDPDTAPAIMEIDLDLLLEHASMEPTLHPLPKYPAVRRDIAVVVDEKIRWADIERCVLANAPDELESLDFLDLYRGKQIEAGKKSIAFSVSFRSAKRTLTNEEADLLRDALVTALSSAHNAELRQR